MEKPAVQFGTVEKSFVVLAVLIGFTYYSWWFNLSNVGNIWLYGLLFFGETYHILMALTFWFTIWPKKTNSIISDNRLAPKSNPKIAIFIPVFSEPIDVVEKTIMSAKNIEYKNKKIYMLNDAFVGGQKDWKKYEQLAARLKVPCITRNVPGGAKAGNINHALKVVDEQYIALFDADMCPNPNFLQRTVPYMDEKKIAFVQTPQFYRNASINAVTNGSWEQQNFFFGSIMNGKNNYNAAFICGTNVLLRKKALEDVGGMCEDNIAEDFLTSLFIHQKGWRSVYISDVLATGLAPFNMGSYYQQQLRWARGSLEVLFKYNPLFMRHLTISQKVEYLSSSLYYFNGLVVMIDMIIPLIFLFFNIQPVAVSTTSFALVFLPYMFLSLYIIYIVSGRSITFRTLSFMQSSFYLQLIALISMMAHKKARFVVTSKQQRTGNYITLCLPHMIYVVVACYAIIIGEHRNGLSPAVIANVAWVIFNMAMFVPFILASIVSDQQFQETKVQSKDQYFHPALTSYTMRS